MARLCKLCKQPTEKFAKSHCGIGRAFFHQFRGDDPNSVLVSLREEEKLSRRIQAGVWDDSILCLGCEAKFSPFDDYGWKILGKPDLSQAYFDGPHHLGYRIKCETDKLRRFVLSSLWRASISKIPAYEKLYLGPNETPMIERVFDSTPLRPDEYPTSIWSLEKGYLGKNIEMIFAPVTNPLESGGLMCVLYLSAQLKIVTMVGDASCAPLPPRFLVIRPDQFVMPFMQKDYPNREADFVDHFRQGIQKQLKGGKKPR